MSAASGGAWMFGCRWARREILTGVNPSLGEVLLDAVAVHG